MSDAHAGSHDDFYQSLLGDFLGESEQILVNLNENLLRLDALVHSGREAADSAQANSLLNELFRSSHSLKGLSNMLGLDEIEELVGHIERLFDAGRKALLIVDDALVALMFEAIDRLAALIDSLKDPDAPAVLCDQIIQRILRILGKNAPVEDSIGIRRVERTLGTIESRVAEILSDMGEPGHETKRGYRTVLHSPVPNVASAVTHDAERAANEEEEHLFARNDVGSTVAGFHDLVDEADISSRFMPIFIDETELALDQITQTLLGLEAGHTPDKLKHLLVVSHRIKGSAASVGLNRAAKLSHLVEDLVQGLLETGGSLSTNMVDVLLKCGDELRRYVDGLKQGSLPIDRFEELAAELNDLRQNASRPRETDDSKSAMPDRRARNVEATVEPQTANVTVEGRSSERAASPSTLAPASADAAVAARQGTGETESGESLLPVTESLRELALAAAPMGIPVYAGVATFQRDLPLAGLKAELLYEKLASLGHVCYFDPAPERFDTTERLDCIRFGLATERPVTEVHQILRTSGVSGAVIEPLTGSGGDRLAAAAPPSCDAVAGSTPPDTTPAEPKGALEATATTSTPSPSSAAHGGEATPLPEAAGQAAGSREPTNRPAETLRVDVERLDQLMNLAGQLVVSKARFAQLIDHLRAVFGGKRSAISLSGLLHSLAKVSSLDEKGDARLLEEELFSLRAAAKDIQGELEPVRHEVESFRHMHASINELEEALHQLGRIADDIQKNVMETRMVPIGPLFMRFHRVVRDITRSTGKSMRLVIRGEKTELDKRMIDELGDPLIHMVRNSADHGIESPEDRERAGKPAEGTLVLDACHRGNNVFIRLSDDGKGLNTTAILRKAVEKGFVEASEAEQMSTHQIHQLVWRPGFSTAERVTETSGRGVGMDIVKSRIESLNGTVEVKSSPGEGTTVTIKLPLTLAILPSLMVDVQSEVFAIPMESVAEIVRARGNEVATIHGMPAARVRGRVVSIVRLDEVFQWNSTWVDRSDDSSSDVTLVIVRERDEEIGLVVDRVIGEEDVVIKSMSENYRNVPGIAGASVLGDGRVSLILDSAAVIAMSARPSLAVVAS